VAHIAGNDDESSAGTLSIDVDERDADDVVGCLQQLAEHICEKLHEEPDS
jgi:hypothetical protein